MGKYAPKEANKEKIPKIVTIHKKRFFFINNDPRKKIKVSVPIKILVIEMSVEKKSGRFVPASGNKNVINEWGEKGCICAHSSVPPLYCPINGDTCIKLIIRTEEIKMMITPRKRWNFKKRIHGFFLQISVISSTLKKENNK